MDASDAISAVSADWEVPVSLLTGNSVNNCGSAYDAATNEISKGVEEVKSQMVKLGIKVDI